MHYKEEESQVIFEEGEDLHNARLNHPLLRCLFCFRVGSSSVSECKCFW